MASTFRWFLLVFVLVAVLSAIGYQKMGEKAGADVDVWEFMDGDLSRLPYYTDAKSVMFSSCDRTGGNDDGFSGLWSRLRFDENGEHVLAEMEGPGCVKRIWMTWPGRSTRIRVYIDGDPEPVVDLPIEEMFSGRTVPFVPPWVGGDRQFGGVNFSYIPIPFEKSVKITTVDGIRFYQINAHRYPAGTDLESFTFPPTRDYVDRLTAAHQALTAIPDTVTIDMPWTVEPREGDREIRKVVEIQPGEGITIFESDEPGVVREFRVSVEGGKHALRNTQIVAWWDGEPERGERRQPSIHVPVADLFGSGFRTVSIRSAAVISDSLTGTLRFPMPYQSARIMLEASRHETVTCVVKMLVGEDESAGEAGRLHIYPWGVHTDPGEWMTLLHAGGRGHYVGTWMSIGTMASETVLEGDDFVVVDGNEEDALRGTGTEDYFNSGWYFARGSSDQPFHGVSFRDKDHSPRLSAYRFHLTDRIPFQSEFLFQMENGSEGNTPATLYSWATAWYQEEPHRIEGLQWFASPSFLWKTPIFPVHADRIGSEENLWFHNRPRVYKRRISNYLPMAYLDDDWFVSSRREQLFQVGRGRADSLRLDLDYRVDATGRYQISLLHAKGPSFYSLELRIDGKRVVGPVSAREDTLEMVSLSPEGVTHIEEGEHRVRILAYPDPSRRQPYESDDTIVRNDSVVVGLVHGILLKPTGPFADQWLVTGPFDNWASTKFDTVYPPEIEHRSGGVDRSGAYPAMGGGEARWTTAAADSNGFVDLREAVGPGMHRTAYAVTSVYSPRARKALFSLGSDDGARVWLNGEEIWANDAHRGWEDDQDRFTGELREGWNEVLLKITQGIAGWGFSLRLTDVKGELVYQTMPD